jgi:hypothetical protein
MQSHTRTIFWRSNFIGDVGPTTYVAPNEPVWYTLQMEQSPRHSWRVSYIQSTITSNDWIQKEPSRNQKAIILKTM